ncbi:hypothetical protein VZT92_012358 [Zoarces viviparus]|uniref:Uncharacterized protein n=1 Tax=Zoarces viviparus TaxID=48416 RepID=A0AAW1F950_ZOAVI
MYVFLLNSSIETVAAEEQEEEEEQGEEEQEQEEVLFSSQVDPEFDFPLWLQLIAHSFFTRHLDAAAIIWTL